MKQKIFFITICLFAITNYATAQEHAADKGATLISGAASFASSGGEMYEDYDENRTSTFTLAPTFNYFVVQNFFVGAGMEFNHQNYGDEKVNTIGIGPQLGYMFGNAESKAFPFVDAGVRLKNMKYDYEDWDDDKIGGTDIFFGAGVVVPIKEHIGLSIEASYRIQNFEDKEYDESAKGNIFSIGIGISGLLF